MLGITSKPGYLCVIFIQINEAFSKVIMQNDVSGCDIFISNRIIQYLDK